MARRIIPSLVCGLAALALCGEATVAYAQLLRPPRATVEPIAATDAVGAGQEARVALRVRLPEGLHVNANVPRDPSLIPVVLTVEPPPGVSVVEIVYPEPTDLTQEGALQPLAVYEREFMIGVRLAVANDVAAGELRMPARLRYQACDEKVCYLPATATAEWAIRVVPRGTATVAQHAAAFTAIPFGTGHVPAPVAGPVSGPAEAPANPMALMDDFRQVASTGGYLGTDAFLTFVGNAEAGVQEQGWLEGRGLLAILVIVLAGGLALNLTPCVLPMIPITLAVIGAGAHAQSRRRGLLLGAAYGGAMAIVYGVLGAVIVATTGTFGTINASPWFNLGIALVFVVLAAAMFDVVSIDFSRFSNRLGTGSGARGSLAVAFGMGAVAALLAGACVAPVVIQVVVFSSDLYASGSASALALPFVLGLGMAIPWPLAGAGISAIPAPGAWMVRVKQAFGVVILGTAAYYGYLGYGLFAGRWVDAAEVSASVEEKIKAGWHSSLEEGLAAAQRDGKPVLIDLWATWCKNCLVMDRTTFVDPAVTQALAGYVKVKVQAEVPDVSPIREIMERVGAIGLPTYVVLKPRD